MYDEERPYTALPDNEDEAYRLRTWETAAGLQAVDGLTVSQFARESARSYVAGVYNAADLRNEIEAHYAGTLSRQAEADVVAARIVGVLSSADATSFNLAPSTLRRLHALLFKGQLPDQRWCGNWRTENISKTEPVLGGRSVAYGEWSLIPDLLDYDFSEESRYRYADISSLPDIDHFADFVAGIWQIHPFREGNTRTVATFAQLYLAQFGVAPGNDLFRDNSTWFRDALVRASYSSVREGIREEPAYIRMFFENIAAGTSHDIVSIDLNVHGIRIDDTPYRS